MALTSPDSLRSPDPTDPYNLVSDLAVSMGTVQTALDRRANAYKGTSAQRIAFTTAVNGMLWQDIDGMKMVWRRDGSAWVPAVWRWSGTNAQMSAFSAPNGFEWFNTTDNSDYTRVSGGWQRQLVTGTVITGVISAGGLQNIPVTFPTGSFLAPPAVSITPSSGRLTTAYASLSATGFTISVNNWSPGAAAAAEIRWVAVPASS